MTRVAAGILAAIIALGVGGAPAPASAVVGARVVPPRLIATGPSYFGVHEHRVGYSRWPQVPGGTISSVRLWDTGTTWREVNPAPGVFVWDTLDAAVANARAHGATIDLVLGSTPAWASRFSFSYTDGIGSTEEAASPPGNERDWVAYVQAVAHRYKGRIGSYETWNEANLTTFWRGSPAEMARLSSLAYRTIKRIDPAAVVTAPSASLRGSGITWLSHYANVGGFRYADAINVHAYPRPEGTPEDASALIQRTRSVLGAKGIRLPVWNSEINYGHPIGGTGASYPLSVAQQSAFVSRTYLLGRSDDVARTYWYDWSAAPFLSVRMTKATSSASAPPGRAFVVARAWLRGRMAPCTVDRAGTYSCTIVYARGRGVVRWNPTRTVTVTTPPLTAYQQNMYGVTWRSGPGRKVAIGYSPMLFRTYR